MITFSILAYFIIFAVTLSIILKDTNIRYSSKFFLITLFFVATIFTHKSITSQQGYAVYSENLPEGKVVAVEIVKETGIYIWIYEKDIERYFIDYILFREIKEQPRSFRIEYSEERDKKYQEIKRKLQKGYVVKNSNQTQPSSSNSDNMIIDRHKYIITDPRNIMKKD